MHRDISSSNILVADGRAVGDSGRVTIIDFGLATTLRQEAIPHPIEFESVIGSLAYISPEQTGRMRRPVDFRTDLYSLGVTLYELLAGRLPFETGDPLEMIHSHLAQNPRPLSEIDVDIPQTLSDIILKLLAKNADDRYRSAQALATDLANCLRQLQTMGHIEPFALGEDDMIGRMQIPTKLYGRDSEITQLEAVYERVAEGSTELLLVAGYPGVGKTSLVRGVRRNILSKSGLFSEGKFDQLQRVLPYSAWSQAFTQLVNQWLAESETDLVQWRETVQDAVGHHGQILINIIPTLKRIIGPQPEVPQLGGVDSRNRLNYTFNRFISSVATTDHPLVVFLDDLQWIDPASLNLMEALLEGQRSSFLVIGAYRDNEVGDDHPLVASQERMRAKSERMTVITLGDLVPDDTNQLLADTLQLAATDCRELSQVLMDRTGGNPFYLRQQLYASESEGSLRIDRAQHRWVWDEALLHSLQAQDSVVDLMLRNIKVLPANTQRALSVAACIGNRFETSALATVIGRPQTDIVTDLNPALQRGLITLSNSHYIFSHDRIQEAGYALIPKSDLPKRHLEIGCLLLAATPEEHLEEEIFKIVSHLNAGRALIASDSKRLDLAKLNLMAGQKAKAASAFTDGKKYVEIGLDLLGPDSWQEQYELTLSMHNENAELATLTKQYDQIPSIAKSIHTNAKGPSDQLRLHMVRIEAEGAQYNFPKALEIGLDVLRDLGVEIPARPTPEDIQNLSRIFNDMLTSRTRRSLAELPEMTDETALVASTIFASIGAASFTVNPPLFPIICTRGAILTLEFGFNTLSPFFFGAVAWVNVGMINHETPIDAALERSRFASLLVKIAHEMLNNPVAARGRTKCLQALSVASPWIEPIEEALEVARTAFRSSLESGDLRLGAYGAIYAAVMGFAAGTNLDLYRNELSTYKIRLSQIGEKATSQYVSIYLQVAQNFKEISPEQHKLNGDDFNEEEWLPVARATNDTTGLHFLRINKLVLMYHFDMDDHLDDYAGDIQDFTAGGSGMFSVPLIHLYFALARLRLLGVSGSNKHPEIMNLINQNLYWMEIWSETTPSTFQHKYDLMVAEKARVTGDMDGALVRYEQAISGARENGFTREEALANELYARFWLERGNERFASMFMREAHSLYRKWGASAKAEHLAKRYPELLVIHSITIDEPRAGVIFDQMANGLDLSTILKASQAIAGEIELEPLLKLLMAFIIENSGAQLGYLVMEQEGQWLTVAHAGVDSVESRVVVAESSIESGLLPMAIVHYVARTQQTVILDEANRNGQFVDDPYIRRSEVKSLLCTPLVNQGKTSAILYLENNLSPGVFTHDRVELLNLLSSQMAISIDNAQLLEERSRALISAEEQIRTLFENSPLGIALSSFDGQFLSVNEALLKMLRISEEELLKSKVTDFYLDPSDRSALLAEVQESGSAQNFGVQLIRNDGSDFFASFNMSRSVVEGNEVLLTVVEDVTDEITAEQEAAVLEERERLARELHDAVTQTLFSASVLAHTSPPLMDKNPAAARQNMEQVEILVHGALAEMRTLLLELRPGDFTEKSMSQLFNLLEESTRARTHAKVSWNVDSSCSPPDYVAIALYRIAQETLNNVAKHALASEVFVELTCDPKGAKLTVKDDGRGFDPQAILAGHLGIGIMRERAQKIGANIKIESEIDGGTLVTVSWSALGDETEHE
jgi:PAS domain S-box-containing protein